jgi:hypothetical protein
LRHRFLVAIAVIGLMMTEPGLAARATGQDRGVAPPDPIAALAAELQAGGRPLTFIGPDKGYAPSLLQRLKVPEDSQVLVFSKTSLQVDFIRPATPRAIYFNDGMAIATIPGAPLIEMWAVGRDGLLRFYTLKNTRTDRPRVQPEDATCLGCHESINPAVPGPLIESVTTLPSGVFLNVASNRFTDGRTPIADRWGGWYITGQHGTMAHRGNVVAPSLADATLPPAAGQNVTDLTGRFDLTRYSRPTSDIVALMTLEHQVGFLNLVGNVEALVSVHADPDAMTAAVNDLADYMLGVDGAALTAPVKGVSGFTERFAAEGPRDSKGRSLREFDLKSRLYRYPLSYMIYSPAFDTLPPDLKTQLYRRLADVLAGRDTSPKYARLTQADRTAAFEIVAATKPDLPLFWRNDPR